MRRVARQEASSSESEAGGTATTRLVKVDTGSSASVGDTSAADTTTQTPASGLVTTATDTDTASAATNSAATASGSSATVATTAEVTTASDAPPTSQTDSQAITSTGGATDSATSITDSRTSFTTIGSDSDVTQSTSDTQSASATLTESNSASSATSTDSLTSSTTTSDTSSFPSSTSSVPSSTASSTSPTSSSTTSSQSTTESSSSDSSITSDSTSKSASTSLTTSFTEIISTIDGQVTTIYSPVATLNLESSDTLTTSHRNAIIAGGTVAGVAFILLCLATVFLCRRHQKRKRDRSHRYLPTPRSVMLAGEDDFDLAGPRPPQRGFGIFGSRRTGNAADEYRDLGSDSGRGLSSPEMQELHNESPPRLLRPVASKTGSYFQESVWPPPEEGSLLSDPIMAASNVDLHSIVDDVMGSRGDASTSSLPPHSRLRGGAAENGSIFSETGMSAEFVPRIPRHEESPTMSSIGSVPSDSPRHLRDESTGSEVGLLANMEGSSVRHTKRSSSGSVAGYGGGPWLPPSAAPPSAYPRATSPNSPLRLVTEPQQMFSSPLSTSSRQAGAKASEAAQERRTSLAVANPSPEESEQQDDDVARARRTLQEDAFSASSMIAPSVSGSTSTSTQLFRRPAGMMEGVSETPYADDSAVDVRSLPPSLAHAWLLDVDEGEREGNDGTPRAQPQQQPGGQRVREELPPRYDMIRRETSTSEDGGGGLSRIRTS